MPKRNRTPAPGTAGARGRATTSVAVDKPFPWGTAAISVLLAALLIGILAYAFMNQGAGVQDERDIFGEQLRVGEDLAREHVTTEVDYPGYPERPPFGGEHSPLPQQCGVYDAEIPPEHAVHSLEHGAAWITYAPDLPEEEVEQLTELVQGDPYRLLSELPGQESPIILTSWARQLPVDSVDDPLVEEFLDRYTNGPLTPERGAACQGSTKTGRAPEAIAQQGDVMDQPTEDAAG